MDFLNNKHDYKKILYCGTVGDIIESMIVGIIVWQPLALSTITADGHTTTNDIMYQVD